MNGRDNTGSVLINHWQRGVPVFQEPVVTPTIKFFGLLAVVGLSLAIARVFSPLGRFSAMTDAYAWGIWKTFNVMTLTALGSAPLAVGLAAWVFNRRKLHIVMRTALAIGLVFYATGLIGLAIDVGRPWNFYNVLMPWHWNTHSAMFEVAICMTLYVTMFLAFENLPMILERAYYTGGSKTKERLLRWRPAVRRIYPYLLVGAYVLPLMHQSSLGGLLLLAGDKINPLWQTPILPLLYLVAAIMCGFGFVTFTLCICCLRFERRLDLTVLSELGSLLSWTCLGFIALQIADIIIRAQTAAVLSWMGLLLLSQIACILVPGLVLRRAVARETPRTLLSLSITACVGGMFYRFIPTTIAFHPAPSATYFPSVLELLISIGYIALAILAFGLAVKYFAVLPGDIKEWNHMFRSARKRREMKVRTS